MELILASASPRRQQMLRDLGVSFRVQAPDIDESRLRGEPAPIYVQRLAKEKAGSVAQKLGKLGERSDELPTDWAVLAADTIVVHGKLVLGKPASRDEAVKMLRKLSGKSHEVITAYCWLGSRDCKLRASASHVRTKVSFADLTPEFCEWYVSTGEPMDKAGSYAAQGIGMSFIERVSGSYSNVVGLPLSHVLSSFKRAFGGELSELCRKA